MTSGEFLYLKSYNLLVVEVTGDSSIETLVSLERWFGGNVLLHFRQVALGQTSAMVIPGLLTLSERQAAPATPEYKDESYAGNLLAIHGTFCGVALLSVLLRLYVRIFMLKSVGVDDYLMVAAAVSTIPLFHFYSLQPVEESQPLRQELGIS